MNSDRFLVVWDGKELSHIAVQPSKINCKNVTCDIHLNSSDAIGQNPTKLFSPNFERLRVLPADEPD
jgi:hypothetical protein